MIDLGMVAKVRPCLVLSVPFRDAEKAVVTYVARSTQTRGGRFEVPHAAANFVPGVFDAQNIGTVATTKLQRRLSSLAARELAAVEQAVQRWLGLVAATSEEE